MTKQKITTIELDPDVWMRGTDDGSLLNHADDGRRQQCCIGIACTALGVSDDKLRDVGMLEDITRDAIPDAFEGVVDVREGEAGDSWLVDRLAEVYSINDSKRIATDTERVEQINAELAKLQAPIRFALIERRAVAGEGA